MHTHLNGRADGLTTLAPVRERYPRFAELIEHRRDDDAFARLRRAETIGRPLGDDGFVASIEALTDRLPKPAKRGPTRSPPDAAEDGLFNALSR